jgi:hypothetical protein
VALPEDVPLAELLPDVLRLVGGSSGGGFGSGSESGSSSGPGSGSTAGVAASLSGYVLTGPGGWVLDTAQSLNAQGVVHGELLRLRAAGALLEAPVHDDIVDAVAEAVLDGGRMWTAAAVRAASLTAVALALGLGAVALWFSASRPPGSFHGQAAAVAGGIAVLLCAAGVWRARCDAPAGGRGSYYGASPYLSPSPSPAPSVSRGRHGAGGDGGQRDYASAVVLTTCALPYAFVAGFGLLPTDAVNGLGRSQFTTGAAAMLILALAAIVGLGRRIPGAMAGAAIAVVGTAAGIGMTATGCAPVSAVAVVAACCAVAIETLPYVAMYAARFLIDPPSTGTEPGDFDGSPVNNHVVALRVERTREMLAGLTIGVSVLLVLCVALLVVPVAAMETAPRDGRTGWEQALAAIVSGGALCRARLFRERGPVLALVAGGLAGLVLVGGAVSAAVSPTARGTWLVAAMLAAAFLGLALSSVRARRGTAQPALPPQWARMVDLVEGALFLGVLPVMLAVVGAYGKARGMHG